MVAIKDRLRILSQPILVSKVLWRISWNPFLLNLSCWLDLRLIFGGILNNLLLILSKSVSLICCNLLLRGLQVIWSIALRYLILIKLGVNFGRVPIFVRLEHSFVHLTFYKSHFLLIPLSCWNWAVTFRILNHMIQIVFVCRLSIRLLRNFGLFSNTAIFKLLEHTILWVVFKRARRVEHFNHFGCFWEVRHPFLAILI